MKALLTTAFAVVIALAAGIVYLSVGHDPLGGEPHVTIAVEPMKESTSSNAAGAELSAADPATTSQSLPSAASSQATTGVATTNAGGTPSPATGTSTAETPAAGTAGATAPGDGLDGITVTDSLAAEGTAPAGATPSDLTTTTQN